MIWSKMKQGPCSESWVISSTHEEINKKLEGWAKGISYMNGSICSSRWPNHRNHAISRYQFTRASFSLSWISLTFNWSGNWVCINEVMWSVVNWRDLCEVILFWNEVKWVTVKFLGTKVPCKLVWPYTEGTGLYYDYFFWCVSCAVSQRII